MFMIQFQTTRRKKNSTISTFNQKLSRELNMARDHQKQGNNNPFSDEDAFVQVVPILRSVG